MIDERTSDSRNSKPPWQADSNNMMCLEQAISTLLQPAPNIWIVEKERVMADGESFYAHHYILQEPLNWLKEAPNIMENTPWFVAKHYTSHCSCIGKFLLNLWRKKKVYTAHIGWKNGEITSQSSQKYNIEHSFFQSDYQSALVDVIRWSTFVSAYFIGPFIMLLKILWVIYKFHMLHWYRAQRGVIGFLTRYLLQN